MLQSHAKYELRALKEPTGGNTGKTFFSKYTTLG
jgi:hypothetical protein